MGVPIGFEPDFDTTPDADLLGYGWLHYDDGTAPRWLNGDAETAALVGRYQDHVQGAPAPTPAPSAPTAPDSGGKTIGDAIGSAASGLFGGALGTSAATKPTSNPQTNLFGGFSTAAAPGGQVDPTDINAPEAQPAPAAAPAAPAPAAPSQVDMTPTNVSNPVAPPPMPLAPSGPPMSSDGLQLFERQGRLDSDVAARQASERDAENQRMLGETEKSRNNAFQIQHDAFFAEAGRQQALMDAEQKRAQEAQDRVTRYQSEQQLVNDAQLHHDLVSAQGPGAILTVVGAALLGATGSQAGLQMINQEIDRYVKTQLQQKDSKLRILADQIGSDRQVAAMATSRYLEASQRHADMLLKLAGADAFNAQTPLILEGMKQSQLVADQKSEQEALGKSTEKAPVNKGVDAKMVQKLGAERRTRQGIENIIGAADQAIGLVWDPQKQDYVNGEEKIKAGFQGTGPLEHLVPKAFYSVFGDKTAEGYRIHGAARAIAYARSQQLQPGSKITEKDVDDGAESLGLNTERGMVNGLRQMHLDLEKARAVDVGQYGPDVVSQYERNYRAGGGMAQTSSPGAAAPASLDTRRAALDQMRTGEAVAKEGGGKSEPKTPDSGDVMGDVRAELTGKYIKELGPDGVAILAAQAAHESGGGKHLVGDNVFGHKARDGEPAVEAETGEGPGGRERIKAKFRKYGSIAEAVDDHVALIKKIPGAWSALQQGDVNAFAAALKDGGYYTDSESNYLRGLQRAMGTP